MSAISANTVIELYNSLSETDKTLVKKEIVPKKNKLITGFCKKKKKVPTAASLLQKHRIKHKTPAE